MSSACGIGAIPPLTLKTPKNPGGTPIEVFDQLRVNVGAVRSQFWQDPQHTIGRDSSGRQATIIGVDTGR